jgi:hypothetical protein
MSGVQVTPYAVAIRSRYTPGSADIVRPAPQASARISKTAQKVGRDLFSASRGG